CPRAPQPYRQHPAYCGVGAQQGIGQPDHDGQRAISDSRQPVQSGAPEGTARYCLNLRVRGVRHGVRPRTGSDPYAGCSPDAFTTAVYFAISERKKAAVSLGGMLTILLPCAFMLTCTAGSLNAVFSA